jgi:hypothetical protein
MMRAMTDAREAALEELYASTPDAFAAKRDAIARRLVREGHADAAAEVKARRRPTPLAYVLNQLARRHPEDLAELVDLGRELARAHRGALRGGRGPDLREAIGRQRSAINRLTAKTTSLMRGLGMTPDGHLAEIGDALHAALVDPAVGAALEEGRLERAPGPAVALSEIAPPIAARDPARDARAAREKEKADAKREQAIARARAEAEACEERLAEADHAAETAESEARAREDAASALANRSGELAAEAERLASEERRIAAESRRLAKAAATAERAAKQARAKATAARADAERARRAAERAAAKIERS